MGQGKEYIYKNTVWHIEERKGVLSASDKQDIEVSTPPEFNGHAGYWSPEDLYVASINSCVMTTFLYYADREKLDFITYESVGQGILSKTPVGLQFTRAVVSPIILVKTEEDKQKAQQLLLKSEKNCLISNSVKTEVSIEPRIEILGSEEG